LAHRIGVACGAKFLDVGVVDSTVGAIRKLQTVLFDMGLSHADQDAVFCGNFSADVDDAYRYLHREEGAGFGLR